VTDYTKMTVDELTTEALYGSTSDNWECGVKELASRAVEAGALRAALAKSEAEVARLTQELNDIYAAEPAPSTDAKPSCAHCGGTGTITTHGAPGSYGFGMHSCPWCNRPSAKPVPDRLAEVERRVAALEQRAQEVKP